MKYYYKVDEDGKQSRAPHGARGLKCGIVASRPRETWSRPARGAWIEIIC